jgi:carboxyl-terminal processing protease
MIHRTRAAWAVLAAVCLAPAARAQTSASDTLPLAERERIAAGLDTLVRTRFAHWEAAPRAEYDARFAPYRARVPGLAGRFDFDTATMALVAGLRNGHTGFWDRWLSQRHGAPLPFELRPVEGRWGVAASAHPGLRPGDEIWTLDGEPLDAFFLRRERYISGSDARWKRRMLGRNPHLFPERFTLGLADGREVPVERRAAAAPAQEGPSDAVPNRWLVSDSVAYLRVPYFGDAKFEARALELLRTRYRGARALVLDVRGNGGGSTPWKLRKALAGGRGRRWVVQRDHAPTSLLFRMAAPVVVRAARVPRVRGPVVVLADGGCFSACEDLVGALRGLPRVTVVGDTTAGSTGQPIVLDLGDGMGARVSARRYLLPGGAPFEGVGVAPDVYAPRTLASFRDGTDPALERALAVARERMAPR